MKKILSANIPESVPGIGKSLANDLRLIGIRTVADLKEKDPEKLYGALNKKTGMQQDPCVLYTFRCAVYYANGGRDVKKLKWWNWK